MRKEILHFVFGLLLITSCSGSNDGHIITENPDTTSQGEIIVDSLEYYKKKLNADPNNPVVIFERAQYYTRHGNLDLAKIDLENLLDQDSLNLKAHNLYAKIHLATLDLKTSKEHYEFVLGKDSANSESYLGLARIYAALDNYAKADAFISASLKINPYSPEPYFTRGLIYRSDYYMTGRESSWDIAVSSFQTAVEQDADYYPAYVEMGVMYAEMGDSMALEYYNSALDIFPESLEAWYNKGMFYQNRGEIDNALNCYYTLNDIDSTWADPYYNIGYIHLLMTEELDSAVFYFEKSTQLDPSFYQAFNNLGLAYEKKGDISKAKKYYQKAIEINPDFKLAKDNLNALM
ncbi:MAG: tetratricopeptide repeat protein [Crocinitomicaceae bacterium]|nr:tetratricopeptide repeat protein [Crocinitomicaceae bacterium]